MTLRNRRPSPLSKSAQDARRPPPPEELVGALQDRAHPASGRLIASKPIRLASCEASPLWSPAAAKYAEALLEAGR